MLHVQQLKQGRSEALGGEPPVLPDLANGRASLEPPHNTGGRQPHRPERRRTALPQLEATGRDGRGLAVFATHAVCCVEGWSWRPSYGSSSPPLRSRLSGTGSTTDRTPDGSAIPCRALASSTFYPVGDSKAMELQGSNAPSLVVVRRYPCAAAAPCMPSRPRPGRKRRSSL